MSAARRRVRYGLRRTAWAGLAVLAVAAMVLADRAGLFGRAPVADLSKYDGQSFRVVRIIDGDTLDIDSPDGKYARTRVRLWGVDTPETVKPDTPVQHFGPQASDFVSAWAAGKMVRLQLEPHRTRDKYGRLLAYVILPDGKMLNRALIAGGYGYADPRYEHSLKREFSRIERQAIKAGKGLWAEVTAGDLPYYHREKQNRSADAPVPRAGRVPAEAELVGTCSR